MNDNERKALVAICCIFGFMACLTLFKEPRDQELDLDRKQAKDTTPAVVRTAPPPHGVGTVVGVQPFSLGSSEKSDSRLISEGNPPEDDQDEEVAGLNPASGSSLFQNLALTFEPTSAGLLARTTEMWEQVAFREYAEANWLGLPLDDLPTHDDCAAGLLCPGVQEILNTLVSDETVAYAIFDNRRARRGIKYALQQTLDADYAALFAALDNCGPFTNWAMIGTEFRKWDQ